MSEKEKTPINFIFAIGYQKYFIDKLNQNNNNYSEQMYFLSSLLNNRDNYLIIINYAFTNDEYENSNDASLPRCIIGEEASFIPNEIPNRSRNVGKISIIHRKSKNITGKTNPNIQEVISDIIKNLEDNKDYYIDPILSKIMIFNLIEEEKDESIMNLTNMIFNHEIVKDLKIELY